MADAPAITDPGARGSHTDSSPADVPASSLSPASTWISSPVTWLCSGMLLALLGFLSLASQQSYWMALLGAMVIFAGGAVASVGVCLWWLRRTLRDTPQDLSANVGDAASCPRALRDSPFYAALSPLTDLNAKLHAHARALSDSLTALETRHKVLTDNIAAAVVLRDAHNRVCYCSPYTEVLTGYAARDILAFDGDFFGSIVPEGDRERYERAFKIGALGEAFQVRHRLIHHSGIEMWVETRTVPILDAYGDLAQSLSVTLDVTGAVRYQRQVEEKNRDLHDFAYMVSHDLKGPLATVKGMLNVLEEDLAEAFPQTTVPNDVRETVEHIRNATHRLEQLVAGVLEYSKISGRGEQSESVDLDKVLQEVQHHLNAQIDALPASIVLSGPFPHVVGEHVWLYQVFSNLLGNAIKYREHSRPLQVEVSAKRLLSGREVEIAVKDNGLGIPADKLDNIFRPFQRAHGRSIEGTGIGLASVKRMLEKCGGSVRVESVEGQGSTFYVTLRTAA